jgi:hypothetical protein
MCYAQRECEEKMKAIKKPESIMPMPHQRLSEKTRLVLLFIMFVAFIIFLILKLTGTL